MPGVRAEKRIFPRLFGSHEAKGLDGIFLQECGGVEDSFVVWNEALFCRVGIGRHTIGGLTDFLDGGALIENE